ncbi:glycosyltransferase [Amycolatopsis sp. YIM 10]|uniref:glycosyltransferase n=1 Tax=Amycolatopsis sp. YIM 10 TaxID=2653857 RepID=UPI0012903682|nr:glycosyltransferase [Amycolatopsis sp. YIM 10]QFU93016.1 Desosaminyl transferase EryCIII precursor [Amycolatopsis sp. YIM 10]
MARVVVLASGSDGDVLPYLGLGRRLTEAGHPVTVAAVERFGDAITGAGLGFHRLSSTDPRQVTANSRKSPMRLMVDGLREQVPEMIRAAERADVLLCPMSTLIFGDSLAEANGIPCLALPLQPAAPTREMSPSLFGGRDLGPWLNRGTGELFVHLGPRMFAKPLADLRTRLGLKTRFTPNPRQRMLHGISPAVVPRPRDWRPEQEMVGFWWPHSTAEPPAELVDFLDDGPPPVYFSFGSVVARKTNRQRQAVTEAIRRSGVRAVVHSGWGDLAASGENVLTVGHVPHEWLLPRVAAVVHHASAGTTAAVLRAGVPSVPVPFSNDQPFWAKRLVELGTAPGVLPARGLTADGLAAKIAEAVGAPTYTERAAAIAAELRNEDGAARVIEVVQQVTEEVTAR